MNSNKELRPLDELVQQLPADSQAEVRDFVEFLIEKNRSKATA